MNKRKTATEIQNLNQDDPNPGGGTGPAGTDKAGRKNKAGRKDKD